MFSLYLPSIDDNVVIDGRRYMLNVAFDVVLHVIDVCKDEMMANLDKHFTLIDLLIKDAEFTTVFSFEQQQQVLDTILANLFPKNDFSNVKKTTDGKYIKLKSDNERKEWYNFRYDAELIYASFMYAYGIDLLKMHGKLSWRKFSALLNQLPSHSPFKEVLEIRQRKYEKGKGSKEANKVLAEQKRRVSYPGRDFSLEGR